MKIEHLDQLKFTKIIENGEIVHFKYNGENYVLINGGREMTLCIRLYKGRMKGHLEYISGNYGMIRNLIEYKNNKRVLSNIDKENFVNRLVKEKILIPTEVQKMKIKLDNIKTCLDQIQLFVNEIEKELGDSNE